MLRRRWFTTAVLPAAVLALAGWATVSVAQDKPHAKPEDKGHQAKGKDIVETAMASPDHKTFCELLKVAGLDTMLKEPTPYTVFGPTDKAFDKVGKATIDEWKKPENKEKLRNLLQFHVVKGKKTAADIKTLKGKTIPAANGQELKIDEKDGKWMVGDATITKTDVEASNGVIHFVDTVLMPKEKR